MSLRPGSYVAFLPCRIQFNEFNSTEISAARSTDLVALSGRNATPIQTSNFCRVESNACIMLMYWACVNVFPQKKKEKLGHSRPNATWTQTALLSALSFSFHWRTIFRKVKVLRRSIFSSAILADIPDAILNQVRHKCDVWIHSRISAALNWI